MLTVLQSSVGIKKLTFVKMFPTVPGAQKVLFIC